MQSDKLKRREYHIRTSYPFTLEECLKEDTPIGFMVLDSTRRRWLRIDGDVWMRNPNKNWVKVFDISIESLNRGCRPTQIRAPLWLLMKSVQRWQQTLALHTRFKKGKLYVWLHPSGEIEVRAATMKIHCKNISEIRFLWQSLKQRMFWAETTSEDQDSELE